MPHLLINGRAQRRIRGWNLLMDLIQFAFLGKNQNLLLPVLAVQCDPATPASRLRIPVIIHHYESLTDLFINYDVYIEYLYL